MRTPNMPPNANTFSGIQITVFGTIAPSGTGLSPSSSYRIDAGQPTFFTGAQQPGAQYMQQFFQSNILSGSVNHTLTIMTLANNGEFSLDYVEILEANETITPTTFSVPISSTSQVTGVPGSTTSSTSSTAPATVSTTKHPLAKNVRIGPIAGGMVAGIAVVVLTVFLLKKKWSGYSVSRKFLIIFLLSYFLLHSIDALSATLDGRDTTVSNSHVW